MGSVVKLPRRSFIVVMFLFVAVSVPFYFWFRAGSRETTRQQALIVYAARSDAQIAADSVARRIGTRLQRIRAQESKRPYFHYQNLFHDPRGASQGLAVAPSPLASGPSDPLIAAHFQIDQRAKVTLPTLNEELSELNAPDVVRQRALRDAIASAAPAALQLSRGELASMESKQTNVLRLESQAFAQNVQSNIVYSELKGQGQKATLPPKSAPDVEILTGDFSWATLDVGGTPTLAALRPVVTPTGSFVQGFVLSSAALNDSL